MTAVWHMSRPPGKSPSADMSYPLQAFTTRVYISADRRRIFSLGFAYGEYCHSCVCGMGLVSAAYTQSPKYLAACSAPKVPTESSSKWRHCAGYGKADSTTISGRSCFLAHCCGQSSCSCNGVPKDW